MQIPETLMFEILGRKEVALEVARRQIADLSQRVRRAEEAEAFAALGSDAAEGAALAGGSDGE